MTAPCTDPVSEIVTVVMQAMRGMFDPDQECPPIGGGTTKVRFLATDAEAIPWDPQREKSGCRDSPFVWVRVGSRYLSTTPSFPEAFVRDRGRCSAEDLARVVPVEVGVARCVSVKEPPNLDTVESESEIALDDSWRIEGALTVAVRELRTDERAVATDTVAAIGPAGGMLSWTGVVYVQF